MGGSDVGANRCAVGGDLLGVSGPQNPKKLVHLGRETAQKRLRNGPRNGRVSAKLTASASPRGNKRSWGVAFPSDQASRRASLACVRVPRGPPFHQPGSFRSQTVYASNFRAAIHLHIFPAVLYTRIHRALFHYATHTLEYFRYGRTMNRTAVNTPCLSIN